ncbi:MAG TPA: glycosyltransferase family 2 protein [Candidatus Elarobacter sp.]
MMKVVMTLLVRDEQDILRENLDFHLAHGVDQFILMDNLSVDGTAEIAREYERAGYLHYLAQPQDDYSQGRWVTEMARRANRLLGADWVINSDADEFWYPDTGSIKDALRSVGSDARAVSVKRTNFVPRPGDGEPFWRRMNVRYASSVNALGAPLPAKVAHRGDGDVVVVQGNHGISVRGEAVDTAAAPMTILHFPVRSRAQFLNKIVKGGAAYERNTALDRAIGSTWRSLYELHLAGRFDEAFSKELLSEDEIARGLADGTLVRDDRLTAALANGLAAR